MNKIWLLEPRLNLPKNDNPWEPWYDKCFGGVVIASSEKEARALMSERADRHDEGKKAWLESKYSTCEILDITESKIVLRSCRNA